MASNNNSWGDQLDAPVGLKPKIKSNLNPYAKEFYPSYKLQSPKLQKSKLSGNMEACVHSTIEEKTTKTNTTQFIALSSLDGQVIMIKYTDTVQTSKHVMTMCLAKNIASPTCNCCSSNNKKFRATLTEAANQNLHCSKTVLGRKVLAEDNFFDFNIGLERDFRYQ
ncbi:uncharacterized protein LOC106081715 [Stomoxys calcitrans]|uniref:uncharacterized protein LOC106081715 n=1 Tax=Stomoxys calcitrans TaxID=35570 RepID=UPI0027E27BEB|nr:uncharacterized protein LOC106081715 [Stomoxys calcitrans]